MSTPKKANSQSVLKNLPPERQDEIADRLKFKRLPAWPDNSQKAVRKWLKDDGIITSERALSEFLSWWELSGQLRQNESTVETVLEKLAGTGKYSNAQLQEAGQQFFSALAIEQKDSLTWKRIQDSATRREALVLAREEFERNSLELYLTWRKNKKLEELADSDLSNADKIAAMRREAFKKVDELQQSGAVVIPQA